MQVPAFLLLFLAPVWVPFDLLTGWVKAAASFNPVTLMLEAGRGFLSGQPDQGAAGVRGGGRADRGDDPVGARRAAQRRARRLSGRR